LVVFLVNCDKQTDPEAKLLCYCFKISKEEVTSEIKACGKTNVIQTISAKIKSEGCDCKNLNPKGVCCLKDISEWLSKRTHLMKNQNDVS